MRPCSFRSMFSPSLPLVLGLVAVVWMGNASAQDIYKWVDNKGVTQYSTTPPPPDVPATRIRAATPVSVDAASQAKAQAKQLIDDAERRAAERSREQALAQARDEAERRSVAARVQRCARAREQLDVVVRGGPVYRYNDRGERIYLEDSRRDAEIARLRGEVAADCSGDDAAQDTATRQRAADAAGSAQCNVARDSLRDLETPGSRAPAWEIAQAREKARRVCGSTP